MPRQSKYFKERHAQRLSREIHEGISDDRLRDPFIITWATRGKRKGGTGKVIPIKASLIHNEILCNVCEKPTKRFGWRISYLIASKMRYTEENARM